MATSHPQAGPTPAQIQVQQAAAAQQHELAKRRSRKPADKNIPDGLEDMVVEGDLVQHYKALRDLERRMDAAMMRKRIDIQEAVNKNVKRYRTLRVWISNTVENQVWQESRTSLDENTFDFSTETDANYRVKIEGRILDYDDDDEDDDDEEEGGEGEREGDAEDGNGDVKMTEVSNTEDGGPMDHDGGIGQDHSSNKQEMKKRKSSKTSQQPHKKFSHFLKSITIDFPQPGGGAGAGEVHNNGMLNAQPQPPPTQIEWRKPQLPHPNAPNPPPPQTLAAADFDALFFERKGDENTPITINLVLDENPERFALSPELSQLLDTDESDRPSVVLGVWDYIKTLALQEDDEKRTVRCDSLLKAIFRRDTIFFPQVPDLLSAHLQTLPPIQLPYTIRVDQAYHTAQAQPQQQQQHVYDIPLLTPSAEHDPLRSRMMKLLHTTHQAHPDAAQLARILHATDDQLATLVQAMNQSKAKHAFFVEMGKDPVGFLQRWLGSQRRDLSVILGESTAVARRGVEDVYPSAMAASRTTTAAAAVKGAMPGLGPADRDREALGGRSVGRNAVWTTQEVRELVALWLSKDRGGA
ncbi:MAG: SWI/SNF complex component snf12 [Peltula sp. TS41687]|nr:MAG: SWI/SNF complex component snf12 [Peltula sp. TS41687]